jgi:peptide/nickel transport system ATP-binding protein
MIHDHTLPARIASIDTAPPGPLLTVDDLYIAPAGGGKALVDGVSFALQPGETLGIVGESGSGKSLTCRAILGVLPPGLKIAGGRIGYRGLDLLTLDRRGWAPLRGTRISAVFQDPGSYLNPSVPVGRQLAEALRATMKLSRAAAQTRGLELLRLVGMRDAEAVYRQYPFELSGGMLQRVLIAIAVSAEPELLIADEPTTALDATVQAEILDLLARLQRHQGLALILVSHDLAVVAQLCQHVIVMQAGRIVEAGPAANVLADARHDYTRSLIDNHAKYSIGQDEAPPHAADSVVVDIRTRLHPIAAAPAAPLLRIDGLDVAYGRGNARRRVLRSVDLDVHKGEIVGLIGETGSGKTTLLRAILGLTRPESGAIHLGGTRLDTLDPRAQRAFRRSGQLQYVFQDPLQSLDPDLSIGQSIAEGLRISGDVPQHEIAARVGQALHDVGLPSDVLMRLPAQLSGGQRQRVVIARALILDPALLLLDEPVSALDAATRVQILELLESLRRERGIAQIFVSHDLGSVAGIASRIAVLYRGEIVESGPTAEIMHRPQHPYTRLLIGSAHDLKRGAADPDRRQELRRALAASA